MNWREAVGVVVVAMGLGVTGACSVDSSGIGTLDPGDGPRTDATGGSGTGGTGAAGAGGTGTGGVGGAGGTGGGRSDGPSPGDRVEAGEGGVVLPADGPTEPYANGWPCTGPTGCASGFCVDNVCCETRCGGTCVACSRARTGRSDGECRPVPSGLDPDEECAPDGNACGRSGACSGNGSCAVAPAGLACGNPSCSGNAVTPPPRCNGSGRCDPQPPGVCAGNLRCANALVCKATCVDDDDCVDGSACDTDSGVCSDLLPSGSVCDPDSQGSDCASGICVDGVCCESACGGSCRACSMAKTGVASGTCAPVIAGQDPDNECAQQDVSTCGNDGSCNGAGACRKHPDGTVCSTACCGGNNGRLCEFACSQGRCDTDNEVTRTQCGGLTRCCCPNPALGGGPACVALPLDCLGACEND